MLKGNGHLKQGLLVGVHEFDLSSLGPGVNSVEHVSPTTGRYTAEPTRPVGNMYDAGGLGPLVDMFAFTRQDVDALVARTRGEFVDTAGAYSHDEIMTTITAWYGGYDFGFREPRYSPLPVVKFLEKMAHGATIWNAATLHWVSTGNAATFEQLMLRHREEVLKLISPLLDDYASGAGGASIRIADQPGKAHCEMPAGEFQRIYLCISSYPGTRATLDSVHELVTLLLHLGYLTMGPGNAVRIPNRELQQMWTRVEAIALFSGPDPRRRMQNMRDRLIGKLNSNITTALEECARESARYIANIEARTHPESVYASHLRNYLGHLLTGWRARVVSEQQQQQQTGQGRPCLVIMLDAPPGHARRHVVIVQMQYAGSGSAVAAAKIEALAMQGLNQIVDEKHAQAYEGTQSRLDVAIVAARNMVVRVRSRAWVWSGYEQGRPSIETAMRPGETHEAWLRRMAAVDQTEWQDGLGWVTVPLQDPRAGADGQ
ncbi:hypothetical protein H4R18_002582 [Coemansia javaensis]|uniref:Uncharacterized protein n=1 Tax=Coemansia javaensis TaxID=2761396 RepID=A0A9W8HCN5_9FUNG|nr:hypothetical protein H4R18_002582 [Coemansia javaensis]